jgi:RNA ligase
MNTDDLKTLEQHVAAGLVKSRRHPTLPLLIYNYAERVQYDRLWDDVLLQCRGLVLDHQGNVVARPFAKFFNDSEHKDGEIPWHLPCEITEKLDGSLIIWFHYAGQWRAATRGSFVSEQAKWADEILRVVYPDVQFHPEVTYLFELIHPSNRIVCDYGDRRDVVLLARFFTKTGEEVPLPLQADTPFPVVRTLNWNTDPRTVRSLIKDHKEGYVLRFSNGFRVKVKGEKYVQMHRALSGVSSRMVWEHLSEQKPLDEVLALIPDEFGEWVKRERAHQLGQFHGLCSRVHKVLANAVHLPDRKTQARFILRDYKDVSGAVFAALDGKDFSKLLWRQLYPEYRRPTVAERIEA